MAEGKRTIQTAGQITIPTGQKIGGPFKIEKNPTFLQERAKIFDEIFKVQQEKLKQNNQREINIELMDGKVLKGTCWVTTSLDIAKKISKKLAEVVVAAKITYDKKDPGGLSEQVADADDCAQSTALEKGEVYDLGRPLEGDCKLELIKFDDPIGKTVFWHSSAHILGAALELTYGGHLCVGPPLENGFYYDVYMGDQKLSPDNFAEIEQSIQQVVKENHEFQKVYLTKQQALELFKHNPFKVQLITYKIPENAITTAYKCGPLIDLCTGPHLPFTSRAKAFKCTKASAAYWLGKNTNDDLQRVYAVSFPSDKELKEHIKLMEEIEKRDHRNIGLQQELFFFSQLSPGSAFMYPHGTVIYNKLQELIRHEYVVRGYNEIVTPNMYNTHLWQTSGHWFKYKSNMFVLKVEEQEFALKPMNCPGHCVMFDSVLRSYKELPLRYADFGVLHRNELSGALSGLTRVRRFQQDDAHIFCTLEQVEDEIYGCLDFINYIYSVFGFEFKLELSTKPEMHLGDDALWEKAEKKLEEALNRFGKEWKINPGDGAFYGPKIDIKVYDALKREHQLGTVQLDFNLPERFNLQYRASDDHENDDKKEGKKEKKAEEKSEKKEEPVKQASEESKNEETKSQSTDVFKDVGGGHLKTGFERPVMVHRAILGSVERMLAILCEHTGGKWPFWISPRQVKVIPISEKFLDYAEQVANRLRLEGFEADCDRSNFTINKKVRNAQLAQYNYIAVVGEEEKKIGAVDLRERDNKDRLGKFTIDKLINKFKGLLPKSSDAEAKLKKEAFYGAEESKSGDDELAKLNEELLLKTFLEGETAPGKADLDLLEKIKDKEIDSKQYPNLFRWKHFVSKVATK